MPGQAVSASGTLAFSSSSANFGTVAVGSSQSYGVIVTNTGTSTVTMSGLSIHEAWCTVSGLTIPSTIAAGKSVTVIFKFAPMSTGVFSGYVIFTSNASNNSVKFTVGGTGGTATAGNLSATPTPINFGTVATGVTNSQTVLVKNTGGSSVTISSATISGTGYKLSGISVPLTLAASHSANFTVSFAPSVLGTSSGLLTIKSNAADSTYTISLSGAGSTSTRNLSLSSSSLNFGSELLKVISTQGVTVTNRGSSSVTVSSINVSGTGFSVSGGLAGATIAAGQSAILNVLFAPPVTGSVTGKISIVSNATDSPNFIAVSGSGVNSTGHSVTLTWSASTSLDVAGYYVYRSTVSGGPYARVSSAATTAAEYVDGAITSGVTYYYVVTTLSTTGAESAHSSQVIAAVP